MAKRVYNKSGIGSGGIVVIIIVAALLFGGVLNKPASVGGVPSPGSTGGGTCNIAPSVSVTLGWLDASKTPPLFTQVANAMGVYQVGVPAPVSVTASSATAATAVSTGIQCSATYFAAGGENVKYYLLFSNPVVTAPSNPTPAITLTIAKEVAPTFTWNNASSIGQSTFNIALHKGSGGYSNGQTVTEMYLNLAGGNGYFGCPAAGPEPACNYAVGFNYNSSEFSTIAMAGTPPVGPMPPLSNTILGNPTSQWFLEPALGPFNTTQLHPIVTIGTLNANTAFTSNIYITLVPGANLYQNGKILNNVFYNTTSAASPFAGQLEGVAVVWGK